MTERIGGREAIRFKFASVVGVRHHGCAKGTGSPERLFAPGLLLERLHLVRAPRGDGKESPRPCGQGGVAPPLPAAQHECLTPVLVCTAVCDSEAFLRIVAMELARLRDTLVQLLAEARAARQEGRATLNEHVYPQLSRKVWEGLVLRFHLGTLPLCFDRDGACASGAREA